MFIMPVARYPTWKNEQHPKVNKCLREGCYKTAPKLKQLTSNCKLQHNICKGMHVQGIWAHRNELHKTTCCFSIILKVTISYKQQ